MTKPTTPEGLADRGSAFWRHAVEAFDLERDEVELLTEICRVLDLVEDMQDRLATSGPVSTGAAGQLVAHPLLAELRASRALLGRLVAQLGLPDELGESVPSGRQVRGRQAASKRWAGHVKAADYGA